MSNLKKDGSLRWIPSYLRRQGQMTKGQKRAYRKNWDRFGISYRFGKIIDLSTHFSDIPGPLHLEIGFGMGENLIHQAKKQPDSRILGIEVHTPGIGSALMKIAEANLTNLRVMRGDARLILSDYLADSTRFDRISVLFPDPWPDPLKAQRRIIQSDLIDLFESRIQPGGHLHIATDIETYRDHTVEVMSSFPYWQKVEPIELESYRGPTRYEAKGLDCGNKIHDLIYQFNRTSQ